MDIPNPQAAAVTEIILKKSKYREVLPEFIESLAAEELAKGKKDKDAIKEVTSKLHQVGAAYQTGQIDYTAWQKELAELPTDLQSPRIKEFCLSHMPRHSSTQERLPIIEEFFNSTLAEIAPVASVLDLACGLNPLAIPWMPLAKNAAYYGCDIYRDLILFLTFSVILVTLVGQGLTLPWVMRALGLADAGLRERRADHAAERDARRQAATRAAELLDQRASEGAVSQKAIEVLRAAHRARVMRSEISRDNADGHNEPAERHDEIALELISAERDHINNLYCGNKLTDDARRRLERELDLREAHIASVRDEE